MILIVNDASILIDLLKADLISCQTAIEKLNHLMTINVRLPAIECKKRLKKWIKGA
jgi:hypothetical protein